nr:DUF1287 domain-containing protein [Massilia sp. IC2-477]
MRSSPTLLQSVPLVFATLCCIPALPALAGPAPDVVAAAKEQIGVTLLYDATYQQLAYPNGDVPADRGVCTDVIVRAYRRVGIDLQELVHRDIKAAWKAYPAHWGLKRPDPNIDHRRVPNLATFFTRHGQSLPDQQAGNGLQAGRYRDLDAAAGLAAHRSGGRHPHTGRGAARHSQYRCRYTVGRPPVCLSDHRALPLPGEPLGAKPLSTSLKTLLVSRAKPAVH